MEYIKQNLFLGITNLFVVLLNDKLEKENITITWNRDGVYAVVGIRLFCSQINSNESINLFFPITEHLYKY